MREVKLKLKETQLPLKGSEQASGYDVLALGINKLYRDDEESSKQLDIIDSNFKKQNFIYVKPFQRLLVSTGVTLADCPEDLEIQVRPRSGISLKRGLNVILGTVDSDYRGEIGVILQNNNAVPVKLKYKEKIAQLVICKKENAIFVESDELIDTNRGNNGFGSTDKK